MDNKLLCRIALESGKVVDSNDRVRHLRAFTFNRIELNNQLVEHRLSRIDYASRSPTGISAYLVGKLQQQGSLAESARGA